MVPDVQLIPWLLAVHVDLGDPKEDIQVLSNRKKDISVCVQCITVRIKTTIEE